MRKVAPATTRAVRLALALPTLAMLTGAASAADLPARAPPPYQAPAAVPAPYYNWTGFYVGGNVGGVVRSADEVTTDTLTGASIASGSSTNLSAVTAGGQIGWNYMWASSWLAGIEVDSQWTGLSNTVVSADGSNQYHSQFDYFGTARGRLGYVVNNWLFYGTGGFAWGHGEVSRTQLTGTLNAATPGIVETADNWRTGWTAGAGIEVAFAPNWTARAEYLHVDLGTATSAFPLAGRQTDTSLQLDLGRFGLNYKFN